MEHEVFPKGLGTGMYPAATDLERSEGAGELEHGFFNGLVRGVTAREVAGQR